MSLSEIKYTPIGIIHSPFKTIKGMPIQPSGAKGIKGSIGIKKRYCAGLKDIKGFSHIILIYHFHLAKDYSLKVKPFLDKKLRGVFATRAPKRPNPIGISVVRLVKVEDCTLHIKDIDVIDGAPLLDIKPYVPEFDGRKSVKIGWLSKRATKVYKAKADERFK